MSIVQMSLYASLLVVAVVLIRCAALNRLPKTMFLILWGVTLLRLLAPLSIPAPFSFFSLMNQFLRETPAIISQPYRESTLPIDEPVLPLMESVAFTAAPAPTDIIAAAALRTPAEPEKHLFSPLMIVWFLGMLAALLFFALVYARNYRELRYALPIRDDRFLTEWLKGHRLWRGINLLLSDRITTPLAVGLLRPRIILPKSMSIENEEQLHYVLMHEYYHIRRFDALWRGLLTGALCLHWFNPLVWLMYILANRDLELSCDEMSVRYCGEASKTNYALTLISMAEKNRVLISLYSNFSKNAVEERVISIMKIKKRSFISILAALLVVIVTTLAFATTVALPLPEILISANSAVAENSATDFRQSVIAEPSTLSFEKITFKSEDNLTITADLYQTTAANAPYIILFHRWASSRGEYLEIAPRLNEMGYNCLAVDTRAGNMAVTNMVINETVRAFLVRNYGVLEYDYTWALLDMKAAFAYVKEELQAENIILWGSEITAALAFYLEGDYLEKVSAVLGFSPDGFCELDEILPGNNAETIKCPVFIAAAPETEEYVEKLNTLYELIPDGNKTLFMPGNIPYEYGSMLLWSSCEDNALYWEQVSNFLISLHM